MSIETAMWAIHAKDEEARVDELEDLVAKIKSTIESHYLSDSMKLKDIYREIQEVGY
jgi:uncharacterized protein YceH (UPF0502 family)